jgi:glycosyltransferase involved in cell wall biosynthesis
MPKVSIAIPAFNSERYIAQSIESMLGQTFGDFELVISDNASTDGTEAICRQFAAADGRVRYVRRADNIGGPANFCHVFRLCQGQYHKWSTADDFWHPSFLSEAVAVLDANPEVVLCYPRTQLVDADGQALEDYADNLELDDESPRERFRQLYRRIGLCNAQLGLIRRDAMLRTRLMASHLASDTDFLGELALLGKFRLLPDVRFYRRFHPASSSWERTSAAHQKAYYDPQNLRNLELDTWRRFVFQFGMVHRSGISLGDKLALYKDLGRGLRYKRDVLFRELMAQLRPRSDRVHGA